MLEIRGERVRANLMAIASQGVSRVGQALYREGERIMTRSKEEFVPVDTGVLKASGTVHPPRYTPSVGWDVMLSYGGAAEAYAIVQHETPWFYHPVGQWKYLEAPLLEHASVIRESLAETLRR